MCGSLTHINPPRVLTSRQVHGGNKEHLYGFIRDLASLIYWQNLPLSACPQLILVLLLCARHQGEQNRRSLDPCPPGLYNLVSEAGQGRSQPTAVDAPLKG